MSSVLVIVLNYDGEEFLEKCLDSIEENTSYSSYDVLVVDNGSEDGSKELAQERSNIKLKELDRNLGYDIANNIGIYESSRYEFYVLLNNDTEVEEKWLSSLVESSKEYNAGIIGPKILNKDLTIQSAGLKRKGKLNEYYGAPRKIIDSVKEVDAVHGSAWMISDEVVEDIGYLDEIFTLGNGEEWDYCYRAKKAGYSIYVDPAAEVIHKEDMTKENMDSKLIYLLSTKNPFKERIMNDSIFGIGYQTYELVKKMAAGLIGYKFNPLDIWFRSVKEVFIDLPDLLKKRYNREDYVPAYYAEGIKDYSKRYEDLQ